MIDFAANPIRKRSSVGMMIPLTLATSGSVCHENISNQGNEPMNVAADKLLTVAKAEIHYWPLCPCEACRSERARREPTLDSPIRHVSIETAHALGFIPSRCPEGSLAKKLAQKPFPPK